MIKIYKYGEVPNEEIFARVEPKMNVEEIVADIIKNVRKFGDFALSFWVLLWRKFLRLALRRIYIF